MTDFSRRQRTVFTALSKWNWHVRFGLRREATQHREGCWRTDDRRSPHRMLCGPRLVDVRLRRASSMAIQRNPSLLGRYAVADANDSLLTRVAIFSTSRSASFS